MSDHLSGERRVALFCAHLVEQGLKSTTVKSYVSAIKNVLRNDGYEWNDNLLLLSMITKACRLINDRVYIRCPITKGLLEILLFEVERIFLDQQYLEILFKTMFILAYYGLLRVGEIASQKGEFCLDHAVKTPDVHVGQNKQKILIILYSSKTHGKESLPQKIRIEAVSKTCSSKFSHFCPFSLTRKYMELRGPYATRDEQFFMFKHGIPVNPAQVRRVLKTCINHVGLDETMFDMHSMRSGKASDMIKQGASVQEVKFAGRWKLNVVYKYIK